jgi:hypothetical protein
VFMTSSPSSPEDLPNQAVPFSGRPKLLHFNFLAGLFSGCTAVCIVSPPS